MVSTLLGYKLYATDISKSLERLEKTASVKKDADYYSKNIGNVTSVDDFLNDYRLYSYAMKAYGLEDQIASKGLIRKVLESDLSDSTSFANKLADSKYRNFAAAFNFGSIATTDTKLVQTTAQANDLVEAYSEQRVREGTAAAAKTTYYSDAIAKVKSVDDLLNDPAMFEVVVEAAGGDPKTVSKDMMRVLLTSGYQDGMAIPNANFASLKSRFNFGADGKVADGATAQTKDQADRVVYDYNVKTGNNANPHSAALNTAYFEAKIGTITKASDLVADDRLRDYVLSAVGLDPDIEQPSYVTSILKSDPKDPNSVLNQIVTKNADGSENAFGANRKAQYTALRQAFGFDTSGNAAAGKAQTEAQTKTFEDAYFANYQRVAQADESLKTSAFKVVMTKVDSLTDLLTDNQTVKTSGGVSTFTRTAIDYVLKAFDIDPSEAPLSKVRAVLTSDVSDPTSYVNKLKDERFEKLAAAFNFDPDGKPTGQRVVQSESQQAATATKYAATFGTMTTAKKDVVKAETKAYVEALGTIHSLDDFVSNDKVTAYALKAYGLEKDKLSTDVLKKIISSDLGDKKSYIYAKGYDRYVDFVKAFNFTAEGTIQIDDAKVQDSALRLKTQNEYLLNTMETQAGDQDGEGVRLALYFRRKAADLTSTTSILADKAVLKVVMTALGLPDGFTQLDTTQQVATIEKKLKVADLKDPAKLDKFITRFAALYDVTNADASNANNPILQLFTGGSASSGGIASLL
ncbi:DUF1217 domain-containing protein [Aureimonas leprariae]|uniref:DUF1217 domain-containing protein n=1 Tax=Plantimonas leprariae TaxID=2615207 RepID=A0A7V7PPG9_9HYPH|nr:DUF1217 domain-containing protein [Aureimonas leprariae]KAB0679884.1 DUF1217 domain-containing protein [Aureimonas leprariae]